MSGTQCPRALYVYYDHGFSESDIWSLCNSSPAIILWVHILFRIHFIKDFLFQYGSHIIVMNH
jgi:hypothetical protein